MFDETHLDGRIKNSFYYVGLRKWIEKHYKSRELEAVKDRSNFYGDIADFYIDEAAFLIERCHTELKKHDLEIDGRCIHIVDTTEGYEYYPLTPIVFWGCTYIALTVCVWRYKGFDKAKEDIIHAMRLLDPIVYSEFKKDVLEFKIDMGEYEEDDDDEEDIVPTSNFDSHILIKEKKDEIREYFNTCLKGLQKPREIMPYVRAAMEEGIISKPNREVFNMEFDKDIPKSTFDRYTNLLKTDEQYLLAPSFDTLRKQFRKFTQMSQNESK